MRRLISIDYIPYFIAALLSILCSAWISGREMVINPDAICYVQSAEAMKQGIHFAMNLCAQSKWPFYSILIAALVQITHFSYVASAYLFDGFFSLLTVLIFMKIISFLVGKNQNKMLLISLGAAVILLAHEWNAVKSYIIRDHGFWAFYLASILFLLYFFQKRQWHYALAWGLTSVMATLFRIEGAVFLLVIPWIAWLQANQNFTNRLKAFLSLNSITIIIAIVIGCYCWIFHPQMTGRLSELQFQFMHGLVVLKQNIQLKSLGLAQTVLGENGARDAMPVLLITLMIWYLWNVITNLSLIYSVLVCYAWYKKLMNANQIIWGYVIVNIFITAIFLGQNMFLSKRYLIALSLTLMLWVPFALFDLIQQWKKRKWPIILAALCIFISSLGGLFDFGYSKKYIRDAGDWLSENISSSAALYSNDLQLMYYSRHYGNQIFTKFENNRNLDLKNQWKKFDYIALRTDQNTLHSNELPIKPIYVFQNKRGDQVRIYRRFS